MTLLRTHIAGIPHRKPSALPPVGAHVLLVPEPTNTYDPNAIKIVWEGIHLGYVPKTETATVRQFGWKELKVVETNGPKWKEVIVENIEAAHTGLNE